MSDHGTHHHHEGDQHAEPKSKTSFRTSFWFVLILVGLFIAALNFMSVMGHEEGHEAAATEQHGGAHGAAGHEAAGHEPVGQEAAQEGHAEHADLPRGIDSAVHR